MNFISSNIKYLRKREGVDQEEFGNLFGCTRDNIASYERGHTPKIDIVYKIVNYFHISFEDFYSVDFNTLSELPISKTINNPPGIYKGEKDKCQSCEENSKKIDLMQEVIDLLKEKIEMLTPKNSEQKRKAM